MAEKISGKILTKEILFIAIAFISFSLGALRYSIKDFHIEVAPSREGVVVSEPEHRDNATRFVFESSNNQKVLVSTDLYSPAEYGDRIILEGYFKRPELIENENGRNFDYPKYLSKDDIYYTMSFAEVAIVSKNNGNPILARLFKIKQSFVNKMRELLPEPEASLLAGLLVAGKDAMPKDVLEEFRRAGLIHIVVLSGYNLTIIADSLRRFFWAFVPRFAVPASVAGIILFIFMTGAEATVVRAGLMVLAVILAKSYGRKASSSRALLAAAFLMVIHNPKILVFDPSFQLSFLATLALVYVSPVFEKYLSGVPEKFGFRGMLSTTLATQIIVLPYLIYSMGNFSLVSLPTNILVLLFIPVTMLVGFIATLVGFISYFFALPFAYITHLFLSYILFISNYFGNFSFASIAVPAVSFWVILITYIAMLILLKRVRSFPQHFPS